MMKRLGIVVIFVLFFSGYVLAAVPKSLNLRDMVRSIQTLQDEARKQEPAKKSKKTYKVKEIEIIGNKIIPLEVISGELSLEEGDDLSDYKLKRNIKNIKSLGFFSDVSSDIKTIKGGVKLIITVTENPEITDISFEGNTIYSQDRLMELTSIKSGDVFSFGAIRRDIKAIDEQYKQDGYFKAKIIGVKSPEKAGDPVVFTINEGVIEEIVITGNTRTQDYVILREMDLKSGMILNQNTVQSDLKKIFNLNYFSEINPRFYTPNGSDGQVFEILVSEKSSGSINFGGGYSVQQSLFAFSDLHVDNFLGTGQLLSLRGQVGKISSTYEFKYHNPWMWENRKGFTFRLWYRIGDQFGVFNQSSTQAPSTFQNQIRSGSDVSISWPFSYEVRTWHTIKYENIYPQTTGYNNYSIQSYRFGISYDTRDVWFNPSTGHEYSFSIEKGVAIRHDGINFEKYDVGIKNFFSTFENQTIATRLDLGYRNGENEGTERYYMGGNNTVRGWNEAEIGSGDRRALLSVEYRLLFNDTFQGIAFFDYGWTTDVDTLFGPQSIFDLASYRAGKGIGIRLNTPIGPIRLDWAYPGFSFSGNSMIHFNIGHAF